jgi:hypothetical protein
MTYAIHSGQAPARPSSKNSYFSTMLSSNSEVRVISYYVFDNILKVAAMSSIHSAAACCTLLGLCACSCRVSWICGRHLLRESHRKIDYLTTQDVESNTRAEEVREDFLAVVSILAEYINHPNAQNLHVSRKHTAEYAIRPEYRALAI